MSTNDLCSILDTIKSSLSIDDLCSALDTIKMTIEKREKEILYLKTENKLLRDSAYKDLELAQMKKQRDKAWYLLAQGFPITDEQKEKCKEWMRMHKKMHNENYSNNYHFIFTPKGLQTEGKIQCGDCKEEYIFQER